MAGFMVTVLMAVRDTPAGMLRQAIGSILEQTLRDFEFLILDDGSQKGETLAELERQARADSRIRVERGPPCGLTRTLNRGLALAAAGAEGNQEPLRGALKQVDHCMLAGDLGAAGRAYAQTLMAHPASRLAWGQLLRCAVYSAVPIAREWCFR
jgi:glycosyltransferase involved in cell wall biosynthesis